MTNKRIALPIKKINTISNNFHRNVIRCVDSYKLLDRFIPGGLNRWHFGEEMKVVDMTVNTKALPVPFNVDYLPRHCRHCCCCCCYCCCCCCCRSWNL